MNSQLSRFLAVWCAVVILGFQLHAGDGKTDIAIYRGRTWWILESTRGLRVAHFGLADDIPIPAAMVP